MAKTYSGDPASSSRDLVRFLSRDCVTDRMTLTDEELDYLLTSEPNAYMAAAMACDLLAEHALSGKTVGDTSLSFSADGYTKLATKLRSRGRTYAVPTAGGLSKADKSTLSGDTDRYTPDFVRGLHDHPDAPGPQ